MVIHDVKGIVTGISIDNAKIDYLVKDQLCKYDMNSKELIDSAVVLKKEGFSRDLIGDDRQLYVRDFFTLYVFDRLTYEKRHIVELGTDLKNDICGFQLDEKFLYASIRNGKIVKVDKKTFEIVNRQSYESGSIWSLGNYKHELIGCTVDGQVLFIDKETMGINHILTISKKNIGSLIVDGDFLYTAGQDKAIHKISLKDRKMLIKKRSAHKRMFDCVGVYKNNLITICHPASEIYLWNIETLELVEKIEIPLKLAGRTLIDNDKLFVTSRSINGIYEIDLKSIFENIK